MDKKLRELQLVQLEILKIVDNICKRNQIEYSLYAGTLLGAVRHKGFIPWDDDLDVCMERSEYERFLEVWEQERPEGYILQNKDNTRTFTQTFSKIRKEHTTFLQFEWERERYHTGIFVDIFPVDRMPKKKMQRIIFKWNCMLNLLLCREFIPENERTIMRVGAALILKLIRPEKRQQVRKHLMDNIKKYNSDRSLKVVFTEIVGTLNILHPEGMLDSYIDIEFEDESFKCFENWKGYLEPYYGDYMKLPPKEERNWRHHPIILDFEHDYEELNGNYATTN